MLMMMPLHTSNQPSLLEKKPHNDRFTTHLYSVFAKRLSALQFPFPFRGKNSDSGASL